MTKRAFVTIDVPEKRKRGTLVLKEASWDRLEEYRQFMSLQVGHDLELEAVVDGLARKLDSDKAFAEWRKTLERQERAEGKAGSKSKGRIDALEQART